MPEAFVGAEARELADEGVSGGRVGALRRTGGASATGRGRGGEVAQLGREGAGGGAAAQVGRVEAGGDERGQAPVQDGGQGSSGSFGQVGASIPGRSRGECDRQFGCSAFVGKGGEAGIGPGGKHGEGRE